jgi:hypothetical protein
MKMWFPTMGPNSDFKHWKRNFLNFLSLKAAYLIPQLAIREPGTWWMSRPSTTPTQCCSMQVATMSALTKQ